MTRHLIAAACVFGWLASSGSADSPPTKSLPPVPNKQLPLASRKPKLNLYIGGAIFPPNYFVTLNGETLTYRVQTYDEAAKKSVETTQIIQPTPDQWREFWKSMDEVGLWNWKPVYEDMRYADGTHWAVEAVHDGRSVKSRGRIFYPGQETPLQPEESRQDAGPLFEKYIAAVRKLIGDRPFY